MVFVGPSWPEAHAGVDGLRILEPAARGDVDRISRAGVSRIGLVDGVFGASLAVSPGELKDAASRGIELLGASSIGALRAAELPGVVTGIGTVFRWFRDGVIRDDDEVACTFDPESFALLSRPLVQLRAAAALAIERGADRAAIDRWLSACKAVPFDARSDHRCSALATAHLGADDVARVRAAVSNPRSDVKRSDARELVERIGRRVRAG